jgi:hypothetical protein
LYASNALTTLVLGFLTSLLNGRDRLVEVDGWPSRSSAKGKALVGVLGVGKVGGSRREHSSWEHLIQWHLNTVLRWRSHNSKARSDGLLHWSCVDVVVVRDGGGWGDVMLEVVRANSRVTVAVGTTNVIAVASVVTVNDVRRTTAGDGGIVGGGDAKRQHTGLMTGRILLRLNAKSNTMEMSLASGSVNGFMLVGELNKAKVIHNATVCDTR